MAIQTLAERIAARKASAVPPALPVPPAPPVPTISPSAIVAEAEETLTKPEPSFVAGKALTFAEKRALLVKAPASEVLAEVKAKELPPVVQSKMQASILSVLKDAIDADDLEREEFVNATPEVQQGYRDIKGRVLALTGTDDDDLAGAMTELKKALLQNPNACLLMLDEDIGRMTVALRRLTQEAIVEGTKAKAEKKPGAKSKKTSQVPLSAEDMQKVFDEL